MGSNPIPSGTEVERAKLRERKNLLVLVESPGGQNSTT